MANYPGLDIPIGVVAARYVLGAVFGLALAWAAVHMTSRGRKDELGPSVVVLLVAAAVFACLYWQTLLYVAHYSMKGLRSIHDRLRVAFMYGLTGGVLVSLSVNTVRAALIGRRRRQAEGE